MYHITKKSLVLHLYAKALSEQKTVFSGSLTFPAILNYITALRENSGRLRKGGE
jgi:hypothetical protein